MKRLFSALGLFILSACMPGTALADPQPATWRYSFDAQGNALATYPSAIAANSASVPQVFNVKSYGAVGDGVTDDSAAIQRAFAAVPSTGNAVIDFPAAAGGYKYCPTSSPTLNITAPNVTVRGVGRASLILPCQTTGDFIHVYKTSGPNILGTQFLNVAIYATGSDPSSGALIHLEDANTFKIIGLDLSAYYGGLFLDGAIHGEIVGTNIASDANFTALATGSYLVKVAKSTAGNLPAEIHVSGGEWRGQNGNGYLDYATLITGTDGVWLSDVHMGFSRYGMSLAPANDTTQLTSVFCKRCYIDTVTKSGLYVVQPSLTYAADFGNHDLDISNIYSTGEDGILWYLSTSSTTPLPSTLTIGQILQAGQNGINLGLAKHVTINDGWSISSPGYLAAVGCGAAGTCNGIIVNNASLDLNIGWGTVNKGASVNSNCAVQVTNAVDTWRSFVIRNQGMTSGMCDTSVTANKSVGAILAW